MAAGALKLYRSNRTERLVDELAKVLSRSPAGPFEREWLVVQGRGMGVWLSQQLAARFGVWGGTELLYPQRLVERVFTAAAPSSCEENLASYSSETLRWAVFSLLGAAASSGDDALGRLSGYLEDDSDGRRRLSLSHAIARVFDRYLAYRPDMLRAWQRGDDSFAAEHDERWQPPLWRALVSRLGELNLASLEMDVLTVLSRGTNSERPAALAAMPRRICVFGLGSLPPMYVRCISALARHVEMHLFIPSLARGYWADEWGKQHDSDSQLAWDDEQNPLIATLGRLGADMQRVLLDETERMGVAEEEPAGEPFVAPGNATTLQRLQSDLLEARAGSYAAAPDDRSITVHACHSPMREVEVLHDQLLSVLTVGGDIEPQDVVVMLADVEAYAPLVEAVFSREYGNTRIPYHIADRSLRHESPELDAINALVDLVGARLSATEVLDLLGREPLRRKLRLTREDLDGLSEWVVDSGIRWGIDAAHRQLHGQPAFIQNTWRFGLQRLLMGYAMPAQPARTVFGVLPLAEVEGQQAAVLGRFALFCEWLFDTLTSFAQLRDAHGWSAALSQLIAELFEGDVAAESATQPILRSLAEVVAAADRAGMKEAISIQVMRDALNALVDDQRVARGFMAGGVTFCAMVPMRNIPFQVVCMLGMGDGDFPRSAAHSAFDLTRKPGAGRVGDRNHRDDDRFLFLEALLSARKRLFISYTGRSIRDNTVRQPSVVVSELCDYLRRSQPSSAARLVTEHPLQAFSPQYFQPNAQALVSYAEDLFRGASQLAAGTSKAPPFIDETLQFTPASELLSLADMLRYFAGPTRYLLTQQLSIDLRDREVELVDRESMTLSHLDRYRVGDELVRLLLSGLSEEQTLAMLTASGWLPHGAMGAYEHGDVLRVAKQIVQRAEHFADGESVRLAVEVPLADGAVLAGELSEVWPRGVLKLQFSRVKPKHQLALWLQHLVLCNLDTDATSSMLVGRPPPKQHRYAKQANDKMVQVNTFRKVTNAAALLNGLTNLYRQGRQAPLPLFIAAAASYARQMERGRDERYAMGAARRSCAGAYANSEHLRHAYRDEAALLAALEPSGPARLSFAQIALEVFTPLYQHLESE